MVGGRGVAEQYPAGQSRQDPVRQADGKDLLVQHVRAAQQPRREPDWHGHITAGREHHVRLEAGDRDSRRWMLSDRLDAGLLDLRMKTEVEELPDLGISFRDYRIAAGRDGPIRRTTRAPTMG